MKDNGLNMPKLTTTDIPLHQLSPERQLDVEVARTIFGCNVVLDQRESFGHIDYRIQCDCSGENGVHFCDEDLALKFYSVDHNNANDLVEWMNQQGFIIITQQFPKTANDELTCHVQASKVEYQSGGFNVDAQTLPWGICRLALLVSRWTSRASAERAQ